MIIAKELIPYLCKTEGKGAEFLQPVTIMYLDPHGHPQVTVGFFPLTYIWDPTFLGFLEGKGMRESCHHHS